jgi:hypothetical protein
MGSQSLSDIVIDLTSDFEARTVKAKLARLPEIFNEAAEQAVEEAASFMVMMAKSIVLVDTGTLRKTIRKERGGEGLNWREVRVRAGGFFVNPKTQRICDYAPFVEAKYPFMRPAADMTEPFLREQIKQGILERV